VGTQRPRGIRQDLMTYYGALLPHLSIAFEDCRDHVGRVRFGQTRSCPFPIVDEDMHAVMIAEADQPSLPTWYLDPLLGSKWRLDRVADGAPRADSYDPAALVMRHVFAETRTRLGLFSAPDSSLVPLGGDELRERMGRAATVVRWLVADQVTARLPHAIGEGMVRCLAESEDPSVPDLVDAARAAIGAGVLGILSYFAVPLFVNVDDGVSSAAVAANDAAPILQACPTLESDPRPQIVVCSARHRRAVRRLLAALADVCVVMSLDELGGALPERALQSVDTGR
jgi:hypothetical protein